ncbi:MAG: damage-inducible protein DinB [Burkholderiales bacterium]|nr:damage-inducible protein DinB [Burkholderiales bacterium]
MNCVDYFTTMARYNRWMNDRLYQLCNELGDEERKKDRGAFFKSIHGTLNHILLGDRLWLGRFRGKPYSAASLDQELYSDFDALRLERAATDRDITAWASALTEQKLDSPLTYIALSTGEQRSMSYWLAAMQLFNHQTHHRGQLTTLLRQAGKDPGVTDLPYTPHAQ